MIVNYDDSSDEEKLPTFKQKVQAQIPKPPVNQTTTTKPPAQTSQRRSRQNRLPDVNSLLQCIPAESLLENAVEEEEEDVLKTSKFETYNHVAPPSYSMVQEAEFNEKFSYQKRKLPADYKKDVENPSFDKFIKTHQTAPNLVKQQEELESKKKENPINDIPMETEKKPPKTTNLANNLIPVQAKTKKKNIPVIE